MADEQLEQVELQTQMLVSKDFPSSLHKALPGNFISIQPYLGNSSVPRRFPRAEHFPICSVQGQVAFFFQHCLALTFSLVAVFHVRSYSSQNSVQG